MGEIADARRLYMERMELAGAEEALKEGDDATEAAMRRACIGLEIDFDEVREVCAENTPILAVALLTGMSPIAVACGQWAEGFVLGLLVAEARKREEART